MVLGYIFEAKQLQAYILETSKLRDASGASELLNALANETGQRDLAGQVLEEAGLSHDVTFIRRAGGVLSILAPEERKEVLEKFRALWRLRVNRFAPGLAFVDGLGQGGTAGDAVADTRRALSSSPPAGAGYMPPASPLVRLAPRTGRAPVAEGPGIKADRCAITKEFIDEATRAKRQFLEQGNQELAKQFAGQSADQFEWPERLDSDEGKGPAFPFVKGVPQRLAIIHADGNNVGQLFLEATRTLDGSQMRALSQALAGATRKAVQSAMQANILPHAVRKVVPARPVLLGGDDLTLLLRADLAADFVPAYVKAFERETRIAFAAFAREHDIALPGALAEGLHAKAGIAFLGARQPFAQGYALCESLASAAKDPGGSRISFFRVTGALIPPNADAVLAERPRLWRKRWTLGEFDRLKTLARLLTHEDLGRGAMRRVPDLLERGEDAEARAVYRRALNALKARNSNIHGELLGALEALGLDETSPLKGGYSPLLDAHDLGQIAGAGGEGT